MPLITTPTFGPSVDPQVARSIDDIVRAINDLDARYTRLEQALAQRPPSLSLAQIQQGLSVNGAAPLNLEGLIGLPAPQP